MDIEIIFKRKLCELHNDKKKISQKKTAHDYYLLKKYEILRCGNVEKLITDIQVNNNKKVGIKVGGFCF